MQNAQKAESLEQNVLAAERKNAMADLAKGVSHDINNALGTVLPLVQQMSQDLRTGNFDGDTFRADLEEIERALSLCRKVFGGMLRIAKGANPATMEIELAREVEATLSLVEDSFRRKGVQVSTQLDSHQYVVGVRADIQQLLLNLLGNARDAMKNGGQLKIIVAMVDDLVHLCVRDSGRGIRPADLKKVCEPFFTTKKTGNGLGLAICHSIVAQMHGRLEIVSEFGKGTEVHVYFPSPGGTPL